MVNEEQLLEEEVTDKAEELAKNTKFDLDNSTSFEKVKPKTSKKVENNKKDIIIRNISRTCNMYKTKYRSNSCNNCCDI